MGQWQGSRGWLVQQEKRRIQSVEFKASTELRQRNFPGFCTRLGNPCSRPAILFRFNLTKPLPGRQPGTFDESGPGGRDHRSSFRWIVFRWNRASPDGAPDGGLEQRDASLDADLAQNQFFDSSF